MTKFSSGTRFFAAVCAGLALSFATGTSHACEPAQVVAEVMGADAERYKAMVNADLPTLARYLGDDLVYTHSTAVVDTKQSYLEFVRSRVVYHQLDRYDLNVTPYGCTAVVSGRGAFQISIDGKAQTVDVRFTNVWNKGRDGWQMVAWQATRIPPKP